MMFLMNRLGSPRPADPAVPSLAARQQEEHAAWLAAKAEEERQEARELGSSLGNSFEAGLPSGGDPWQRK